MEFSGRLASFPIADLLAWAHNDRRSGSLVVRRSGAEKRVYFRDGQVVASLSTDPAEFYGQYLLAQGVIDERGLVRALQICQSKGLLLGDALIQLSLVPGELVAETLQMHVEDQVCELFLWRTGIFYFTNEMLPDNQVLPVPLDATRLALEGSRRADEHGRIRRLFVHDNIALRRSGRPPGKLTPLERRIFEQVDGERSLVELYNEVRGSWYRFLEAAYRLTAAGALDIAEVHEATEGASIELQLADLLLEQVTEERAALFQHHLSLPFDAIERAYPVWVREPGHEAGAGGSGEWQAFDRRIDGETSLRELFGTVPIEQRAARMDRLVLHFRSGALALLPQAASSFGAAAASPGWWRGLLARR